MKLTCNRKDGMILAALWEKGVMTDLYIDAIISPDLSGALVCARLGRVMAGNRAGWFDAGLGEKIYVESKTALSAGVLKTIRIVTSFSNGKACRGEIVAEGKGDVGILEPPPLPWQRALEACQKESVECFFADDEDRLACMNIYSDKVTVAPVATDFSDMDERIDELTENKIALSSGGEIVIEPTEALVAIDVNAGEARNPLSVNLAAMHEVARQIRLRNLGGIILIDALKMPNRADHGKMLSVLNRCCASDPAGVEVFGITKLGLIEMTRTRRGLSLMEI